MRRFSPLRACAALAAVLSCPAFAGDDGPWAEVRVGGQSDEGQAQYDVMLVAIDGSMDFDDRTLYKLPPGMHGLRLASFKRGRSGEMTAQTLSLELQPCMRYALAADHAHPEPNRSWQPRVAASEPIKGCMKKYGDRLQGAAPVASAGP